MTMADPSGCNVCKEKWFNCACTEKSLRDQLAAANQRIKVLEEAFGNIIETATPKEMTFPELRLRTIAATAKQALSKESP